MEYGSPKHSLETPIYTSSWRTTSIVNYLTTVLDIIKIINDRKCPSSTSKTKIKTRSRPGKI